MRRKLVAETIGSMLLVMASVGSMVFFTYYLEAPIYASLIGNALSVGFILFALIETFGPISGAHFNPVVSTVMAMKKEFSPKQLFSYIFVQILGGLLGVMVTHLMFFREIGVILQVATRVRDGQNFFSETVSTFILVLVILVLVEKGSEKVSLTVGLLVGGQIVATSSTMFANPMVTISRMFTPAISGIRPENGVVFILMQFVGGFLAYFLYKMIFQEETQNG